MHRFLHWPVVIVLMGILGTGALAQKYEIYTKTLGNGLDVIVISNPIVPLVTIEIDVKNGAYTEPPEYDGLSHLYEHMFFKANKAIPNQEKYLERLRELGARWNGTTSDERVNYFITVPRENLEAGLEFMYNAITSPLFLEEELIKERPVVNGEYDRNEANPYFHLGRAVNQKVWWKYFSRKNVIGDREIIMTTTPEKMRTIQNRFYIPNNSALILAGDISAEEGFALAEKYYGSWTAGEDPFAKFPVPEHPAIEKTETIVIEKPVNAVGLMMVWQGPSVSKDPKATYAADVLSFISRQQTSKFTKNLVESGLAYGASLGYYTLNHTGPITLFAQTSPEKYQDLQKAVDAELKQMAADDYFTDDQLENAKTILAIDEQYGREKPSDFAHTVGFWWAVAGLDYYYNYIENLNQVTRDDIKRYLNTYIIDQNHITGVLVAPDQRAKLGI